MTALVSFLERVMEPLPGNVLVDTAHNGDLRRAASGTFLVARRRHDYYLHLVKAIHDMEPMPWLPVEKQTYPLLVTLPHKEVVSRHYREALLECLMTLTGSPVDVEWKRRRIRRRWGLPSDISSIEAAIARDEAFIAAHPVRIQRARKGGAA